MDRRQGADQEYGQAPNGLRRRDVRGAGAASAIDDGPLGADSVGSSSRRTSLGPLRTSPGRSPRDRRIRAILVTIVAALAIATVAGLFALWPRGDSIMGSQPRGGEGVTFTRGTVQSVDRSTDVAIVRVDHVNGPDVAMQVAPEIANIMQPGDRIKIMVAPTADSQQSEGEAAPTGGPTAGDQSTDSAGTAPDGEAADGGSASGPIYSFLDFDRGVPMGLLAALFVVLVLIVARWRGLAALAGLVIALGVVGVFILPALLAGESPVLVSVVGSAAILFVVLYLAHGINGRTTSALLGTFAGLGFTVALAWWSLGANRLTGYNSDEAYFLPSYAPAMSVSGILLCGTILAGIGVLNDVTITQSSAVWELRAADPSMPRMAVFRSAMRIGRDHIASTVYTMAFAYVGASLAILLYVSLYDVSLADTVTAANIADEIVRTLVASIGLVLAIPLTTLVAALVVTDGRGGGHGHGHGLVQADPPVVRADSVAMGSPALSDGPVAVAGAGPPDVSAD